MRNNGRSIGRRMQRQGRESRGDLRATAALARAIRPVFDPLERRILQCVDHLNHDDAVGSLAAFGIQDSTVVLRPSGLTDDLILWKNIGPRIVKPRTGPQFGSLGDLPQLNSKPGAAGTIFLDFDGDAAQQWGSYAATTTPAYTQDNDVTTFSAGELTAIQQIWGRVAEAYSPFNVNVTTVDPGSFADGQALKIVIGGSGAWLGAAAGGVAYVGAYTNSAPNVVWVFPANLAGGNVKYTADGAIHESGHAMGLQHQSQYSGSTKTAEYRQGDSLVAPYMGVSYYAQRGKWSNGQSALGYNRLQDDMVVIAGNPFGWRADEHGDTIGTADALTVSGNSVSATGVLARTTDVDVFSFVTNAGPVSFTVSPAPYGGMIDITATLMDVNGNILVTANTTNLGESLSADLTSGAYRLVVSSKGLYGDVGQYSITGTIVSDPDSVANPTSLTSTSTAGGVSLTWFDNAWNETGYVIERSSDGGQTYDPVGEADADSTGWVDGDATVGVSYRYRVYATGAVQDSGYSNVATVAVTPATPGSLVATSVSASSITLTWADVAGETGYVIERSLNGTTWGVVASPAADETTWTNTGLTAAARYYYRIKAAGAVGNSATTAAVNAVTRPATPVLTLSVASATQVTLLWTNVAGETGYRLERSTDGGSTWSTLATAAANVASYANTGLVANTLYHYRVTAVGTGGDSGTSTGSATTLLGAPTGLTALATSATQIHLTWFDSTGESGYRLERTADGKNWLQVAAPSADVTEYDVTGLVAGTAYTYRLRALNAGGASAPTGTVSATTIPPTPTLTATAYSNTQVNLAWTNVPGETSYLVERSVDGLTDWSTIATPAANVAAYNNTGLTADTVYYYRVTARNAAGDSAASTVVARRTLLTAPTGLLATGMSTSQVDLVWPDATGESGYVLERSPNGSTLWTTRAALAANATTWSDTGLVAGTLYYYRLRATNTSGNSWPGGNSSAWTIPAATPLTVTAVSPTQVKLAWTNVAGETGFKIERSADGQADWAAVTMTAANVTAYTESNLTADTTYFYRVTPTNSAGDGAASTVKGTRTLLPSPTGLAAAAVGTNRVDLTWPDSTGETGYVVERSLNNVAWSQVAVVAADDTDWSNTGLNAGTAYTYRVRAANAGGNSAASTAAGAVTVPGATAVSATGASATQINLAWGNIAGETGYRVEVSTDNLQWTTLATKAANVTSHQATGLTADTLYYFRVTPFNAAGDAAATTVSRRTVMGAPTGVAATALSATSIKLTWSDSGAETGYKIDWWNGKAWALLASVAADTTEWTKTGLVANRQYLYRVRASNAGGDSAQSATATVLTPASAPTARRRRG